MRTFLSCLVWVTIGVTLGQQYWPGQVWRPQNPPPPPNYRYWPRFGRGAYGQGPYEGTIWKSGWIPARNLNGMGQPSDVRYPAYSDNQVMKDYEVRDYVERYFPNVLSYEAQPYNQRPNYYNQPPPPYYGRPPYPAVRPPYEDPTLFPEVIASCDSRHCYLSCRLGLMGGGRCTKAGCMCYIAFFNADGSPTSTDYPEDNMWFDLTEAEREQIRQAMRDHQVQQAPATARPPYNPPGPKPDGRPPYNPDGRPPRPTVRPPYRVTTTTKRPPAGKGDRDFFSGDTEYNADFDFL